MILRKVYDKISDKINRRKRLPYLIGERERLTNHDFSIISSNCIGGVVSSDLHVRFNSPTINLYMTASDYIEFLKNLKGYLESDLVEDTESDKEFPVGILGNRIRIYFMHYTSFEQAKSKWNERRERVNYDNLFVVMTDRDGCTENEIAEFDRLPYENKIIFTSKQYPEYSSCVFCKEFEKDDTVGSMTQFRGISGARIYDRYFDFVAWFNR